MSQADKPLPSCHDIERKVLAAVLMEPGHLPRLLADGVTDADFGGFYRQVWQFIAGRGGATIEAVAAAFSDQMDAVAELMCIATTAGIDQWVKELRRMTARRQIIAAADAASRAAYDLHAPIGEAIATLATQADRAADAVSGQRRPDFAGQIEYYSATQDAGKGTGERVPYGLPIDSRLCHCRRELHVIGAKPATGKTNLALNAMLGAIGKGFRAVLYCQEMPVNRLLSRLVSMASEVPYSDILAGKNRELCRPVESNLRQLAADHWLHIRGAGDYLHRVDAIREDLRHFREVSGRVDLVAVDYLQNMRPARHMERCNDPRQIIDYNVAALQEIAAEFDVAALVLSQLNRQSQRSGTLDLTALKESSAIEQAASIVTIMSRQDATPQPDYSRPVPIKLDCVKYRDGQRFSMHLLHDGAHCRFIRYDSGDDPNR